MLVVLAEAQRIASFKDGAGVDLCKLVGIDAENLGVSVFSAAGARRS